MKKTFAYFIIVALLFGNFISNVEFAKAQIASSGDPAAQPTLENSQEVDITTDCFGVPEDADPQNPGDVFPPTFNVLPPDGYPPLLPALEPFVPMPLGSIDWKVGSIGELLNSMGYVGQTAAKNPAVHTSAPYFAGNEDSALTLTAVPDQFSAPDSMIQFAWWLIHPTDAATIPYSLNGVVAGGVELKTAPLPAPAGSRCGIVTRNPKDDADTDTNNDGMGDRWEMQYFGKLNVDPNGDKDQDGVIVEPFVNHTTGQKLSIVPSSQSTNPKGGVQKFSTGDGKFSNLEEYIWGTNPLDPDSDDDGYLDEADVDGLGQTQLIYTPDEFSGTRVAIQTDALGTAKMQANGQDALANKIAGYVAPYVVHNEKYFYVSLSTSNSSPDTGTLFRVRAETLGTDVVPNFLKFDWEIHTQRKLFSLSDPDSACTALSFGNVLDCNFPEGSVSPGDVVSFDVTVHDPLTGVEAHRSLPVPIGGAVLLSSDPLLVPQYPYDPNGKNSPAPAGDAVIGERWVAITANLPGQDPSQYRYFWSVDQSLVPDTCATRPLQKDALGKPVDMVRCGVGTNILYMHATGFNSAVYNVYVRVLRKMDSHAFGAALMPVYTDTTPAVFPGTTGQTVGLIVPPSSDIVPGDVVRVSARNIETSNSNTYQYDWTVDGSPVPLALGQKQLTFTADSRKTSYSVALTVTEEQNGLPISRRTDIATIHVKSETPFVAWKNARLAALSPLFAPLVRSFSGVSSLFFLALGIILIAGTLIFDRKTE